MPSNFTSAIDWASMLDFGLNVAAVLICLVVHEVCHGLAAWKLGDPTAKMGHRLSFNPLRHLDPIGLLMMVVAGFGWGRPVPVDPRYFRNPKSGMAITALAGPVSNFVLAFLGAIFLNGTVAVWFFHQDNALLEHAARFFYLLVSLNIGLGIFNLIPFPPLDGSKVLGMFLPDRLYYQLMRYERYGMVILMAVLWLGWLNVPLYAARRGVFNLLVDLTGFAQTAVFTLLGG